MSEILDRIRELVEAGDVRISEHGYEELADDNLSSRYLLHTIPDAKIVEEYPNYPKGPCVLLLQRDEVGAPIHILWGIPKGKDRPAVLVTAYRPDPERWQEDFLRRR